jgi:hypothetical protein
MKAWKMLEGPLRRKLPILPGDFEESTSRTVLHGA